MPGGTFRLPSSLPSSTRSGRCRSCASAAPGASPTSTSANSVLGDGFRSAGRAGRAWQSDRLLGLARAGLPAVDPRVGNAPGLGRPLAPPQQAQGIPLAALDLLARHSVTGQTPLRERVDCLEHKMYVVGPSSRSVSKPARPGPRRVCHVAGSSMPGRADGPPAGWGVELCQVKRVSCRSAVAERGPPVHRPLGARARSGSGGALVRPLPGRGPPDPWRRWSTTWSRIAATSGCSGTRTSGRGCASGTMTPRRCGTGAGVSGS